MECADGAGNGKRRMLVEGSKCAWVDWCGGRGEAEPQAPFFVLASKKGGRQPGAPVTPTPSAPLPQLPHWRAGT